jgi:hypothetical protein
MVGIRKTATYAFARSFSDGTNGLFFNHLNLMEVSLKIPPASVDAGNLVR